MKVEKAEKRTFETFFSSDVQFNGIYPMEVRQHARRHWTPLNVAEKTAEFLAAEKNKRILDIGSGVGKFCLAAAHYKPAVHYTGVEQRSSLIEYAEIAKKKLGLFSVSFIHGNFTQLDFRDYDHFYFYNSFFENLVESDKIDDSIAHDPGLYHYYTSYLYRELIKMPAGTKVVTYCSWNDEIPPGYQLKATSLKHLLKFWIKR